MGVPIKSEHLKQYCSSYRVVTGLRLMKLGRVFHLQISEGTLGERGSITAGDWVPIQKFDPTEPGMRDGVDYHMLTYQKRAIDLDELDSPAGHVLTGVRYVQLLYSFVLVNYYMSLSKKMYCKHSEKLST